MLQGSERKHETYWFDLDSHLRRRAIHNSHAAGSNLKHILRAAGGALIYS